MQSVGDQIHEDLLDLNRIGHHLEVIGCLDFEANTTRPEEWPTEVAGLTEDLAQSYTHASRLIIPARKSFQAVRDTSDPEYGVLDLLEFIDHPIHIGCCIALELLGEDPGGPGDDRQRIVDLVPEPGGELPDCSELLRLEQFSLLALDLPLHIHPLGDVIGDGHLHLLALG